MKTTSTSNSYTFTGLSAQTSYSIKVEVADKLNNIGTGTKSVTTAKKPAENVNEVGEAEYVNYVAPNGETLLCAVLYDSSSPYGVEIITMECPIDIELGNNSGQSGNIEDRDAFNTAINNYNNAISTLNNEANKYLNTTYATRARSVGSNPSNPSSETGYYTPINSFVSQYGSFKGEDDNYITDYEQMGDLGIRDTGEQYWLASRYVNEREDISSNYGIKAIYWGSGNLDTYPSIWIDKEVYIPEIQDVPYSSTDDDAGLRPVFKLKSNVKITGGSGTKEDPYTLGV